MSSLDPHAPSENLGYLGARDLLSSLARGDVSSVELVTNLLARAGALDGANTEVGLRSIAAIAPDALEIAARCDAARAKGEARGELFGVPVVVKDNVEATGLPGTAGSTSLIGRAVRDAPLVTRLRDAGAIVMASTNLSQWANIRSRQSTSGWSATGGLVGNPWSLDRSAGGSSSGSGAAVAAGLAPLAVGTETDGSIVCPSSLNGVVGLKPTVGTVPGKYVVPISLSQDSAGPMGRSVDDVALLYGVLARESPPTESARDLTFAHATTWRTGHPATDSLFGDVVAALRSDGQTVFDVEAATPADEQANDEMVVLLAELVDDLSAYLADRPGDGVHSLADVVAHEDRHAPVEMPFFGHDLFVEAIGTGGRRGDAYATARARNLEWALGTCLVPALERATVLVAPSYGPAWKSDLAFGGSPEHAASCVTMPAAIAGWPIVSVPMGFADSMPVGIALVARPHDEWRLLDAARVVERIVADASRTRPTWRRPQRG